MRVVLPPALQRVWPALVSQIIIVMLGSAVCGQISAEELSYAANLIQSRNFRAFEAFIVATAIYLGCCRVALRRLLQLGRARASFFGRVTPALAHRWSTSRSGTSSATCCWRRAGRWRCR